uniref:Uncharacterized protein n=1 Tax=Alexandrium monilatum TaxID=311494 RepID=A0A7S4VJC7_9DINO
MLNTMAMDTAPGSVKLFLGHVCAAAAMLKFATEKLQFTLGVLSSAAPSECQERLQRGGERTGLREDRPRRAAPGVLALAALVGQERLLSGVSRGLPSAPSSPARRAWSASRSVSPCSAGTSCATRSPATSRTR